MWGRMGMVPQMGQTSCSLPQCTSLVPPEIGVPVNCCSVSLSQQLGTPSFEAQTPRHVPSPWPAGVAGPV